MARETQMKKYLDKVITLLAQFQQWKTTHIPRDENAKVDMLANLGPAVKIIESKNNSIFNLFHSVLGQRKNEVNSTNLLGIGVTNS